MLSLKKVILFLIVGVFLFGLSNVVFAVDWTANLTNIYRTGTQFSGDNFFAVSFTTTLSSLTSANQFDGVSYLRNASSGNTYNGYVINITIINYNRSGDVNSFGIDKLNITLPAGMGLIANSNVSSVVAANFTNISGTVQGRTATILQWYGTNLVNNVTTNSSFSFNVTSLPSVDGLVNFVVSEDNTSSSFNISGKVYLDGTIPTFNSAKTNDTTHLNLTFSENMNASSVKKQSMFVQYTNRSGVNASVAVTLAATSGADNIAQNDTQFTLTISAIESNETPYITLNMSNWTAIMDLAGYEIASNTSLEASDGAPPTLKRGTLDLSVIGTYTVNLTLEFDEKMASIGSAAVIPYRTVAIAPNNSAKTNVSVKTPISTAVGGINETTYYLTLNFTDQGNITRFRSGVYAIVQPFFFNDSAGNLMSSVLNITLIFTNDSKVPTLVNYTYFHETNGSSILQLGFNEAVDIPTITTTQVRLAYNQNHNLSKVANRANLSDSSFTNAYVKLVSVTSRINNQFYKTINLTLNSTYTNLIAAWDRKELSSLYLSLANISFYDLSGNALTGISNTTGVAVTWNKDETVPTVLTASISDVNVTGPGVHRITIQFSENMTNSTQIEISNGASALTEVTNKTKYTILEGTTIANLYYNFTDADTNGVWTINVTTAKDLSGNSISTTHTGLNFTYDSDAPYILYAYYLNNGTSTGIDNKYNGTLSPGDQLVLVFSEPLQPVATVNLTSGNVTFKGGGAVHSVGNNFTAYIVDNKVIINITSTDSTIYLRGEEWVDVVNASALQGRNNRDVSTNTSSWYIRDKADNFATNLSVRNKRFIADYAVEIVPNQAMTISFPTCVNAGNMSSYLPSASYITFAKFYNTSTWGEHTVSQLSTLAGYRFTFNNASVSKLYTYSHSVWGDLGDNVLRIYLANQSDCSLESNEITIDAGWNFLALNGNYYSSSKGKEGKMSDIPDNWLASLSSDGTTGNIQVGSITPGFGNTSTYSNANRLSNNNWDVLIVKPYEGWWVQSTITSSTKPLTGVARY